MKGVFVEGDFGEGRGDFGIFEKVGYCGGMCIVVG